jgi:hypothetical protein
MTTLIIFLDSQRWKLKEIIQDPGQVQRVKENLKQLNHLAVLKG